jgi:Tyrosine-protein kinase ephrin type A/B receptor-like
MYALYLIAIFYIIKSGAECSPTFQRCGPGCYNKDNVVLNGGLRICIAVGAGYFSPRNDNNRYACARGTYSNNTEAESCSVCPAGSISDVAFQECFLCPAGFYQELPGQYTCKQCVPGYNGEGANSFFYSVNTNTLYCELTGIAPSEVPSQSPSRTPTMTKSQSPSTLPSRYPSEVPSMSPTTSPTMEPSRNPSQTPSLQPSLSPTKTPSAIPSLSPTKIPTQTPSFQPTVQPSHAPSEIPTVPPSFTASESTSNSRHGLGLSIPVNAFAFIISFLGLILIALAFMIGRNRRQQKQNSTSDDSSSTTLQENAVNSLSQNEPSKLKALGEIDKMMDGIIFVEATCIDTKCTKDSIV